MPQPLLKVQRVETASSPLFARIDALYESAFPLHEKRTPEAKRAALQAANYQLQAWFDEAQFVGLIGVWQFAGYSYIEHLAVDDLLRGQGYGKRMLDQFLRQSPLTVLEIDPLTSETARKRLCFYHSLGFKINHYPHFHPSYHDSRADHELIVLSHPCQLDQQQYQRFFNDLCHSVMANDHRTVDRISV